MYTTNRTEYNMAKLNFSSEKWLPEFSRHESINLHVPCSPCTLFGYTPRCPYDVRCLKEISVVQVLDKIKVLLNKEN